MRLRRGEVSATVPAGREGYMSDATEALPICGRGVSGYRDG